MNILKNIFIIFLFTTYFDFGVTKVFAQELNRKNQTFVSPNISEFGEYIPKSSSIIKNLKDNIFKINIYEDISMPVIMFFANACLEDYCKDEILNKFGIDHPEDFDILLKSFIKNFNKDEFFNEDHSEALYTLLKKRVENNFGVEKDKYKIDYLGLKEDFNFFEKLSPDKQARLEHYFSSFFANYTCCEIYNRHVSKALETEDLVLEKKEVFRILNKFKLLMGSILLLNVKKKLLENSDFSKILKIFVELNKFNVFFGTSILGDYFDTVFVFLKDALNSFFPIKIDESSIDLFTFFAPIGSMRFFN
ncbi:hypothetical protein K9M16_00020 [Candidatus Babeliales bacterium]|nr:hypothetical protein [Candidatus Babeliales bacterium]